MTPVLKYEGGEAKGQSATFQGEKVQGNDQTIAYKAGGTYTMKSIFDFVPAMQQSDLYLQFDAKVGKKTVSVPEVKVGYGVIATSQLLQNTLASVRPSLAADAYQRIIKEKQEANIKFLIQQAKLRDSELNSENMKEFIAMMKQINDEKETKALKNIEVSAYASPDGALDLNTRLAEQRQDNSEGYLQKQLKANKMTAEVDTKYTAEDWDGFQELVSQSNIQDKEVILRVLSMYKDPEEREAQIKNMSAVFKELAETILPELRRARLTMNYEIIGRSDEQIVAQFGSDASKLSVEELLYGANLASVSNKEAWYQKTSQLYPNDYRAYNNLGMLAYQKGDLSAAENYFNTSLYAYCGNNPISRIDPTGADWYEDKQGNLRWQEGSEALKGYTNIGSSASIALGNDNYLNFYQNGGILANRAVNAFDLIASSGKLQNQFLGKTSPLSEDSKSALFNSLNSRSIDAIARPIGEAAFSFGAGEFGGILLGKALGWAVGKVAGKAAAQVGTGEFTYTKTAARHFSDIVKKGVYKGEPSRPYMNSSLTIQEIMQAGKGIPDATFKGGLNWKVPGAFRGAQGIWELGINPETKVIYHFNFTY